MPTLSFKPGKRRLDFAKQACLSSPGQKDCSSFHPALLSERAPWQRHSTPSPASCGVHACDDALLHSIAFTAFHFASIALLFCPVPSQTHSPVLMPGAASVGGRDKRFKAFLRGRVKPALRVKANKRFLSFLRNTTTRQLDPAFVQRPREEEPCKESSRARDIWEPVACGVTSRPQLLDGAGTEARLERAEELLRSSPPRGCPQATALPLSLETSSLKSRLSFSRRGGRRQGGERS